MLLTLMAPSSAFSWGSLGHDASVLIAEKHLTRKAKKNLAKYLENRPLVYYASWMDYMGYVTKSGYSNDWFDHCVPVDKAFEYDEGGFPGDALIATETAIERLGEGKYKSLDDSTVLLLIKHLVHFVPDMHCPSHIIYNFRPSNYWVTVGDQKKLFHGVWDNMLSTGPHEWSATEWCEFLDRCTPKEVAKITEGSPRDWVHDNATACIIAYDIIRENTTITDPEFYRGNELAEKQLLKGGLRLAYVLNLIFGR